MAAAAVMNEHDHRHSEPFLHGEVASSEWRDGAEKSLLAARQRSTVPRRAILAWIAAQHAPFTAEALVTDLETERGQSSRATIYRTIEWLKTAGWIARVHTDGAEHTYARVLPAHHHHVVCTRCGVTLVLGGCELEGLLGPISASTDFEIHGHLLEFYGVCKPCRNP